MFGLHFQISQKLDHDFLNLLNQSKIPGHCGFALANPHSGESRDFVPEENIGKNLEELCIRWGSLKYLDDEIAHANLKNRRPSLLS